MVRYNSAGTLAQIFPEGQEIRTEFMANVRGIAPGQSAVWYDGDDVIGGGRITRSI